MTRKGNAAPDVKEKQGSNTTAVGGKAEVEHAAPAGPPDESATFLIAGVGASAGGYEALISLLGALPSPAPLAVVVIQHLDPTRESQLVELLARHSKVPVAEIKDGAPIEAGHVYVIGPGEEVVAEGARFRVRRRPTGPGHQHVIDTFLRSLAHEHGGRAAGVILSGTLADGTLGLREIKAAGGFTFAQDLESATHRDMPRNAIVDGHVDFVLGPKAIADELCQLATSGYVEQAGDLTDPSDEQDLKRDLSRIFATLKTRTGVDFSGYKRTTLMRRLNRRVVATKSGSLSNYVNHLRAHPNEARTLFNELLILVTRFWRDEEAFHGLLRQTLPELMKDRPSNRPLRLWSVGCATGEEAYSLAITVREYLDEHGHGHEIQLFGTDVSPAAIATARQGEYPAAVEADIAPQRLERWFERRGPAYVVKPTIRNQCIFAVHDLTADPPFSQMDVVFCRNLLIYMEPQVQQRIVGLLHYALRPSGTLVLGRSEAITRFANLFRVVDADGKLYRKKGASMPGLERIHEPPIPKVPTQGFMPPSGTPRYPLAPADPREMDRLLLQLFCPPAILVNQEMEVMEFRGETSPFVSHPPGPADLKLVKLLRPGLSVEVRAALGDAMETGRDVTRRDVTFKGPQGDITVDVRVTRVDMPGRSNPCHVVLFMPPDGKPFPPQTTAAAIPEGDGAEAEATTRRLALLERELNATRDHLEGMVQDYEAANEELRSANEEALAANEELQSTNEELEMAKEELQSTNEEMATLNEELRDRNQELEATNDDLGLLLEGIAYSLVVMGPNLAVRRFTTPAATMFHLRSNDIGRPFGDINHGLEIADLESELRKVVHDGRARRFQAAHREAGTCAVTIRAYRPRGTDTNGVVLVVQLPEPTDD